MHALAKAIASIPKFSLAGKKILPAKIVSCYDYDSFYAVIPIDGTL